MCGGRLDRILVQSDFCHFFKVNITVHFHSLGHFVITFNIE